MSAKKCRPDEDAGGSVSRPAAGASLSARLPLLIDAWRGGGSRSPSLDRKEVREAGAALLTLQRGLTGDRRFAGSGYMDDSRLLGAYLLYYWPVSYMEVSLALVDLSTRSGADSGRGLGAPKRILDLGSGPGPAAAAVVDWIAEIGGPSPEELVLADSSPGALDIARRVLEGGASRPGRIETLELDLEAGTKPLPGDFDLIAMGHSLNELWRGRDDASSRRTALLRELGKHLTPGGLMLLAEPALLLTSRELIAVRDNLVGEGWSVLGPCPGAYPCPILSAGDQRTCHSESPWTPPEPVAALAAEAGLDRRSVKWTHFFLSPPAGPEGKRAVGDEPGAAGHAGAGPRGDAAGRVVSDPMLNKAGRLRYLLCGDGGLATISAKADDPAVRGSGFAGLRRGDEVMARGLEARPGGGLGFGRDSRLEVTGPAPEAAR